ncbi:MAG TPA: FeoB-associated Cys-rich membrane protein [Bacilli bacterium]|nr:FeoB-associated Cys-rich membrane protein [Bacilli bacterium]
MRTLKEGKLLINWLLGGLIFGYAFWALSRFIKKSKQGKCASCSINKECQSKCSSPLGSEERLS